jgi:chromosome segregation ATPase
MAKVTIASLQYELKELNEKLAKEKQAKESAETSYKWCSSNNSEFSKEIEELNTMLDMIPLVPAREDDKGNRRKIGARLLGWLALTHK